MKTIILGIMACIAALALVLMTVELQEMIAIALERAIR